MRPTYRTPDNDMARVFRLVPSVLARTSEEVIENKAGRDRFVCHALGTLCKKGLISERERDDALTHVELLLEDQYTLESWLKFKGVNIGPPSRRRLYRMQQHRRAWMEVLAKEFES